MKVESSKIESGPNASQTDYYILNAKSKPRKFEYIAYGEDITIDSRVVTLWEEKFNLEDKRLYKIAGSSRPSKAFNRIQKGPDGKEVV